MRLASRILPRWFGRPKPLVTCAICSIDDQKFRAIEANYARLLSDVSFEIIGIHNAKSLAAGYNQAVALAKGKYLILSHDDIQILSPDFAARLLAHLSRFDMIGVAGTTRLHGGAWFLAGYPHNYQLVITPDTGTDKHVMYVQGYGPLVTPGIQALDGLFLAMRTSVAVNLSFDDVTFDGFHLYDIDLSYRAYLAEYKLAVCRDLVIVHQSHGKFDAVWNDYRRRFEKKFEAFLPSAPDVAASFVGKFPLAEDVLTSPDVIAALCRESQLAQFVESTEARRSPTTTLSSELNL